MREKATSSPSIVPDYTKTGTSNWQVEEWGLIFTSTTLFGGQWDEYNNGNNNVTYSENSGKKQKAFSKERCQKNVVIGPGWCGLVDQAPTCEPKGCQFNYQSGQMSGLQARCPVGGVRGNQSMYLSHIDVSLSLSLSLSLFLFLPLSLKVNK